MASTIGILGGMGPEATNQLCNWLTALTPVTKDQDHIPVITYNNPKIPERVGALVRGTENPVPEMVRTAKVLQQAGADFLLMPCNLAHYFITEVQAQIQIPILNMIEETVRYTITQYSFARKIGILASSPTIQFGIYEKPFLAHHRILVSPSQDDQEKKVMEAIYGEEGVKRGHKTRPRDLLTQAAHALVSSGAEIIISGCTEVSVVMMQRPSPFIMVDPMEVIAQVAIRRALSEEGVSMVAAK